MFSNLYKKRLHVYTLIVFLKFEYFGNITDNVTFSTSYVFKPFIYNCTEPHQIQKLRNEQTIAYGIA